jgi:hypothetical protein
MKKIHPDFPIYLIENFHTVTAEELPKIIETIIYNQQKHRMQGAASFWLMEDDNQKTFSNLYFKFENTIKNFINFNKAPDNIPYCNVYYSTKTNFVETVDSHGRPFYHNHKHTKTHMGNYTTLAGVYYMNVPDTQSGDIEFKIEFIENEDGSRYEVAKDIRYNQFSPRPYEKINGTRTTKTIEISYQPKNGDLVLFPSYLDHRPRVTQKDGHRIAVNFELQTKESAEDLVEQLDKFLELHRYDSSEA